MLPRDRRVYGAAFSLGLAQVACYAGMALLPDLRQYTVSYLALFGSAFALYCLAVWWSLRQANRCGSVVLIVLLALSFRIALLFSTPPSLSDDVYRYLWDGRLVNAGVSPYAQPVNSPLLDHLDSPQRALVNNEWMASPYLPVAQVYFAAVYRLVPGSPLAFQMAAMLLDLLTGGLVLALLHRLALPWSRVLIYLWNPLVVVEFTHGAHVDALMLCLMVTALWALIALRSRLLSVAALAAATLTKALPVLLLPVLAPRWGWRWILVYGALIVLACVVPASGAGWGLSGPLAGTGLFGAIRIYAAYWNYNGGLYHWLEAALTGWPSPGALQAGTVDWGRIWTAKRIVTGLLAAVLAATWWWSRKCEDDLTLVRLAGVPLAAYLLLTPTVHPWYVALIVPLLPFLSRREGETTRAGRFLIPGLYLCAAVGLSYLTYVGPPSAREEGVIRLVEYLPVYLMLIWAAWPASGVAGDFGQGSRWLRR